MNELESVMRYSGPRRSCLVVPGNKPSVLEKARGLAADEIIIDLEDTVPPEQKDDALRQVVGFLNACDGMQKRLTVRVNDTSTSRCHRDVLTLIEHASAHLDAIMLPMTETAGQVQFMHWLMHGVEAANGVRRPIGLVLQLETSAGLLAALTGMIVGSLLTRGRTRHVDLPHQHDHQDHAAQHGRARN